MNLKTYTYQKCFGKKLNKERKYVENKYKIKLNFNYKSVIKILILQQNILK